jgi:LGFP repeat
MKDIEDKYHQVGGKYSMLQSPIGKEQTCSDRIGRFRRYKRGVIYAHPDAGVHVLYGDIMKKWMGMGAEQGPLGYPTSDVLTSGTGKGHCSCFQRGRIYSGFRGDVHVTDLHSDRASLDWIAFNARYLPDDWMQKHKHVHLPDFVDYSGDVDFIRNQGDLGGGGGGGYGCITYAFLHILDILKDWEQPFCPAVSWHYVEWFNQNYNKVNHRLPTLPELAEHGVAFEGNCHTNYDTEFRFVTDPRMIAEKTFYYPFPTWDEPSDLSRSEAPLNRVRSKPLETPISSKPKNTGSGLLSPSVAEIKQLLRSCGPLFAGGVGHAKAIVGFNDAKKEFTILDSYLHGDNNFITISYEKVGPSFLFPVQDDHFSSSLAALRLPSAMRDQFKNAGWPIPAKIAVTKQRDDGGKRWLFYITADPEQINEIKVVFLVEKRDDSSYLNIYDNQICWDCLAIENFCPVVNVINEDRVNAPSAYSARIRIENNWRGTYTVSVGAEGQQSLAVWTTRGRNLQNVKENIAGIDVDWETPVETARFLQIDVPLPDYAKNFWPPSANRRWVLTVEDHDRDNVQGVIKNFILARRYTHPDCHSVGKYRTETYGGAVSVSVPDPSTGQIIQNLNPLSPPAEANPNPGIARVYVPATTSSGPTQPRIHYSIELDEASIVTCVAAGIGQTVSSTIPGNLSSTSTMSPHPSPVSNTEVRLMRPDIDTCKPWQWLTVARTTTDTNGDFIFDFSFEFGKLNSFAVAFYDDAGNEVLASSDCIEYTATIPIPPEKPQLKVKLLDIKKIKYPDPYTYPWEEEEIPEYHA